MPRNRILVNTSPVANRYANRRPDERIIEFDSPHGGGLIAFAMHDDGTLTVEPYRLDDTVTVKAPAAPACPACGRELRNWPLERPATCSPKRWMYCIRPVPDDAPTCCDNHDRHLSTGEMM